MCAPGFRNLETHIGGIDSLRFASLWLPGSLHYVRVDILDRGGAPPAPPLLLDRELDHVS